MKKSLWVYAIAFSAVLIFGLSGCYRLRSSAGGGQTDFDAPRKIVTGDIALPKGYRIEPVAAGLTFPTGITFDAAGTPHVVESGYAYGEVWTTPRLLRIEPGGKASLIASGGKNGPWTGVTYHEGNFYVAEGGAREGGNILRITPEGKIAVVAESGPTGDHHTNGPVIGPDGWLYFAQGTATNSAVVGEDNHRFGWLKRDPDLCDIPCQEIVLAGENYTSGNPFETGGREPVTTGAFVPFGTMTTPGQIVRGELPCSGAVLRVRPEGGKPELVAWGFRNPFGLAFSGEGALFSTDNQYDVRGSRPIFGAGDLLWEVRPGVWYGWPDYHGGNPVYDGDRYRAPGRERPKRLLEKHPNSPPRPVAVFAVHSSSNGFDFSRYPEFGHVGEAFVAQFGDGAPVTGKVLAPVGFKVVRVDIRNGVTRDFAVNKGPKNGPASLLEGGGLERPVAARFDPSGKALYIVDFGVMLHDAGGAVPKTNTGVIWRITRAETF
jgi:glucose/arabinose dehydrogenase